MIYLGFNIYFHKNKVKNLLKEFKIKIDISFSIFYKSKSKIKTFNYFTKNILRKDIIENK